MKKLLILISSLWCTSLLGNPMGRVFEVQNPKRLIPVIDVVDGSMLSDVAMKINDLSNKSSEPIELFINSPGGSVMVGTTIVDAMTVAKQRGVTFRCLSSVISASMAFIIFAHCDERYVLPNTKLLFHPVSVNLQGGARVQELIVNLEQTKAEELEIMSFLQKKMGLEWQKFHMHYFSETMWAGWSLANHTGGSGKFLNIVTDVVGIPDLFRIYKPRNPFMLRAYKGDYYNAQRILLRAGLLDTSAPGEQQQPPQIQPIQGDK